MHDSIKFQNWTITRHTHEVMISPLLRKASARATLHRFSEFERFEYEREKSHARRP